MEQRHRNEIRPRVKLSRQFSWSLPGNLAYAASLWLTLVLLAKWGTPEQVGQFGLAWAVTAPVFMFANLRLRIVLSTDSRDVHPFHEYLRIRLLATGLALASTVVVTLLLANADSATILILLVALTKAAESLSDIFCGWQQKYERSDRVSISLLLSGVLGLCGFAAAYWPTRQVVWGAGGMLLGRVLALVLYDVPLARSLSAESAEPATDEASSGYWTRGMTRLFWQALPLGVTAMLVSLNSNVPRYLLAYFSGKHDLGIFCSLAAVMAAGTLVFRAIEQPASPRLAQYYNARNMRAFWRLFNSLVAMFTAVGLSSVLISLMFGRPLLTFAFTPEYAPYTDVLALLMLATAAAYAAGIVESSLICARLTTIQLPMHVCTLLLCFLVGCWLIPVSGMKGAAIAISVCRFPYIVIGLFLLRRVTAEITPSARTKESSSQRPSPSFNRAPEESAGATKTIPNTHVQPPPAGSASRGG